MIRAFEKEILNDIHFAERFINAINACVRDNNTSYKLLKKDVKGALSKSGYYFENVNNQYISDITDTGITFRLMFDIKDDSVLTYIFVLKGESFLNNGLSHFGFMLNSFDLTGYEINQNFGFNSIKNFSEYIGRIISIFEDFKKEFINREKPD
ncbi:MAG: hypothetical protein ACJAWV_003841 [Flammeovirgaceae bacterium]|jgi:hypothetical protein